MHYKLVRFFHKFLIKTERARVIQLKKKQTVMKWLGAGLIIIIILWGNPKSVIAHPTNSITLNPGTTNEFIVPKDATSLVEPELIALSPLYNSFVQGKDYSVSLSKNKLNAFSSKQQDYFNTAGVDGLSGNKSLRIISSRNDQDRISGISPTARFTQTLVLLDADGNILDSKNIATGGTTDLNSTNNESSGDLATGQAPIISLGGDKYEYKYQGRSPSTLSQAATNSFSLTFKISGNSIVDMNWTPYIRYTETDQALEYINSLIGGNPNESYHYGIAYNQSNHLVDIWNGTQFVKKVTLKVPNKVSQMVDGGTLWGTWMYDLGYDSVHNQYYAKIVVNDVTNTKQSNYLYFWDMSGEVTKVIFLGSAKATTGFKDFSISSLTTSDKLYYVQYSVDKTELRCIDLNNGYSSEVLLTLPARTTITVEKLTSTLADYMIYGQYGGGTGILDQFGIGESDVFIGYLDSTYQPISAQGIKATGKINVQGVKNIYGDRFLLTGYGTSRDFTDPPVTGWSEGNAQVTVNVYNALFGTVDLKKDFAPLIKSSVQIFNISEISETAIKKKLLEDLEVFDNYDFSSQNISGAKSVDWLKARLNRNPNKLKYLNEGTGTIDENNSLPIEWNKLGFKTDVGPYLLTYFLTDSNKSVTSTSNFVNNVDKYTTYDEDYAIRAENFDVGINTVDSLTTVSTKAKSNLLAWGLNTGTIIDDGTAAKNTITVNDAELQAIKDAKSNYATARSSASASGKNPDFDVDYSDILKPYPLTFSYDYTDSNGSAQTLTKRITVFVTGETTKVDKSKNLVLYADNFRYPLKKARDLTNTDVLTLSHSAAYNYNHIWSLSGQTNATKLPNNGYTTNVTDAYQSGVNEKLSGLNNAKTAMDYVMKYQYTQGSTTLTNDLAQAQLYEETVILHIRQLVENPDSKLVIPTSGYFALHNIDDVSTKNEKEQIYTKSTSGTDESAVDYQKVVLPTNAGYLNYWINRKELVPQYYEASGYKISKTNTMPTTKETGDVFLDYSGNNDEYWVTLYIQPSTSEPAFYGWNYGQEKSYQVTK